MRATRYVAFALALGTVLATQLSAEKITVTTGIERNPVGLGEKIYLYFDIDYSDPAKIETPKVRWSDGLTLVSGPAIRSFWDSTGAEPGRKSRVGYVLRADRPGRIIVDSLAFKAGGVEVVSDPIVIGVGYWRNREVDIPLRCDWVVDSEQVYVGQAVRASLVLRDMIEVPVVGDLLVPAIAGVLLEELPAVGELERERVAGVTIYQLPVAAFLVTPSRAGRLELPRVTLSVGGQTVTGNTGAIVARELPDAVARYGAVGEITFRSDIPTGPFPEGEAFPVTVGVEGVGNLNYLELPSPETEGLVLAGSETIDEYEATELGYQGIREARYRFLPQSAGNATITIGEFSVLDPISGEIDRYSERRVAIEIVVTDTNDTADEFPFALDPVETIRTRHPGDVYRRVSSYLWLLPGAIGFFVLFVLKRTRVIFVSAIIVLISAGQPESNDRLDEAYELYAMGRFEEAAGSFETGLRLRPGNPGLLYNRSVCEYRSGNSIAAVHLVRLAIDRAPEVDRYREFAAWQNDEAELPDLVYPALDLDPDLLFYLCMVAAMLAIAGMIGRLVKPGGGFTIVAILSLLIALGAGAALFGVHRVNQVPTGIISTPGTVLRSIPSASATVGEELPPGVSVRVIDRTDRYLLVRNGPGRTGWIPTESLYFD